MRSYLISIILCSLISPFVIGQAVWHQFEGPYAGSIFNYASTGDTIFVGSTDNGVFKSIDNGVTWENTGLEKGRNAVYVEKNLLINQMGYSVDYGKTWKPYNNYAFNNYRTIYSFQGDIYAGTDYGVYKFNREGKEWISKNRGIKGIELWQKNDSIIMSFASIDNILFCGTFNKGLFESKDKGESWEKVPTSSGLSINSIKKILNFNDTLIALGPGSRDVFLSSDAGKNWNNIQYNLSNGIANDMVIYKDTILMATDIGVFKFDKKNNSWEIFSNEAYFSLYSTKSSLLASNIVGLYRWNNLGRRFVLSNRGLNSANVWDLEIYDKVLYAATFSGAFYTNENGKNWNSIAVTEGISCNKIIKNDTVLFLGTSKGLFTKPLKSNEWKPSNSGLKSKTIVDICSFGKYTFVATDSGPYFSKDYGKNWKEITSGYGQTYATRISSGNGMVLTSNKGIYKLSTDTSNWTLVGFKDEPIETIKILDGKVYAWVSNNGLYRSIDSCKTWVKINANFTHPLNDIFKRGDKNLYASSYGRVYYSSDGDKNWKNWTEVGLPNFDIEKLAQGDSCLYAATNHNGIWYRNYLKLTDCSSSKYSISENFITNIPSNTPVDSVKANIELAYGASSKIIQNTSGQSFVRSDDIVKVIAEDGKTFKDYRIQVLTSINNVSESGIKIYPSPAHDKIFLSESTNIKSIAVYNIRGELLLSSKMENNSIDISILKRGTYFLTIIKKDNHKINVKFIKE